MWTKIVTRQSRIIWKLFPKEICAIGKNPTIEFRMLDRKHEMYNNSNPKLISRNTLRTLAGVASGVQGPHIVNPVRISIHHDISHLVLDQTAQGRNLDLAHVGQKEPLSLHGVNLLPDVCQRHPVNVRHGSENLWGVVDELTHQPVNTMIAHLSVRADWHRQQKGFFWWQDVILQLTLDQNRFRVAVQAENWADSEMRTLIGFQADGIRTGRRRTTTKGLRQKRNFAESGERLHILEGSSSVNQSHIAVVNEMSVRHGEMRTKSTRAFYSKLVMFS